MPSTRVEPFVHFFSKPFENIESIKATYGIYYRFVPSIWNYEDEFINYILKIPDRDISEYCSRCNRSDAPVGHVNTCDFFANATIKKCSKCDGEFFKTKVENKCPFGCEIIRYVATFGE